MLLWISDPDNMKGNVFGTILHKQNPSRIVSGFGRHFLLFSRMWILLQMDSGLKQYKTLCFLLTYNVLNIIKFTESVLSMTQHDNILSMIKFN